MNRRTGLLYLGAGLLIGVVVTMLLLPLAARFVPTAVMERLPPRALGHVMMARAAETVIADSRKDWPLVNSVAFYDRPEPVGDFLCVVHVYGVQPDVVAGARIDQETPMVTARTAYGLRGDPSDLTATQSRTREEDAAAGCRRYRDFTNLIDGYKIEDPILLIDLARDALIAGKADFPITCISRDDRYRPISCDGVRILKTIDLNKIRRVTSAVHVKQVNGGLESVDEVVMDTGKSFGHPAEQTFTITSWSAAPPRPGVPVVDGISSIRIESEIF